MDSSPPPAEPRGRRKRSGSAQRRRSAPVPVRYLPEERAELQAAANAAGMSVGAYIRDRTLKQPITRGRRQPSVDIIVLLGLKAELNRVGGHLYQLVRHLNFHGVPEAGEARAALSDYLQLSAVIRAAIEAGGRRG